MSAEQAEQLLLEDFRAYVNKRKAELNAILKTLDWTNERLAESHNNVVCSVEPTHKMQQKSIKKHEKLCRWKRSGLTADEKLKQLPSSKFAYEHIPTVKTVNVDSDLQQRLISEAAARGELSAALAMAPKSVPVTPERAVTELLVCERLAIYNGIVEMTRNIFGAEPIPLEELQIDWLHQVEDDEKYLTKEERLAAQRDYKRRRPTYKGKVATGGRTYTEVLRDIIANQTSYMKECAQYDKRKKL